MADGSAKKTVTLKDVPEKAVELEEYVAALFQASRHFVEKQVIEREPQAEILELDAVATAYDSSSPVPTIVEAKSGNWGFADIFKVLGWMKYLDIPNGAFFVSKDIDKDQKFIATKCADMKIGFVHLGDFKDAAKRFELAGFPAISDELRIGLWRFSYWIERALIDYVRSYRKSNLTKEGPAAALDYLHLVNNGVFFTPDIRQRLRDLYSAYQSHPKLALGIALEMAGGHYDPKASDPKNALIGEAMLEGKHQLLHAAFYVEHRARLAILKAAVDHESAVAQGKIPEPKMPKIGEAFTGFDLSYWTLPASFRAGLDKLKTQPSFHRYPLFWQVFLWGLGGFYLTDRTDAEFKWLSDQTGVPIEDIPTALEAFDVLFPIGSGSWLVSPGKTHVRCVKMMPYAFHGLGAFQRRFRHGIKESYSELGYSDWTGNDLTRWHNGAIELLA